MIGAPVLHGFLQVAFCDSGAAFSLTFLRTLL